MTKGNAFAVVHFSLMIMACVAVQADLILLMWPSLIAGIIGNAGVYIGGNVMDNRVKGQFYQEGLKEQ